MSPVYTQFLLDVSDINNYVESLATLTAVRTCSVWVHYLTATRALWELPASPLIFTLVLLWSFT